MKKNSLIILLILCYYIVNAQDIITMKNGQEFNAFIKEKTNTKIYYKFDSISNVDTTFCIKLSKIRTIRYNNGRVDLLSSQNLRSIYPFGVNGGVSFLDNMYKISANIDYFLTPNISTEIDLGSFVSFYYYNLSLGAKYWFANKYSRSEFSPFIGLLFVGYVGIIDDGTSVANFIEVPFGVSFINKFGFQMSLHLSYLTNFNYFINPNIEFRVGWRFK